MVNKIKSIVRLYSGGLCYGEESRLSLWPAEQAKRDSNFSITQLPTNVSYVSYFSHRVESNILTSVTLIPI